MISQLSRATFYDTELNSEGEGPSRGLLNDYESSDGPSFQALPATSLHYAPAQTWRVLNVFIIFSPRPRSMAGDLIQNSKL